MTLIIETRSLDSVLLFVVQLLSRVWLSEIQWTAALQASLSFTVSQSLLKLLSTESMMPSKHLILGCPFLLLPSIFSSIKVFFTELALCILSAKVLELQFQHSPSNEYSGLISFRIDWFDLLAVKGLSRVFSNTTVCFCFNINFYFNWRLIILQYCSGFAIHWHESATPQFESINSLAPSFLYSPTFTSIQDYRKKA